MAVEEQEKSIEIECYRKYSLNRKAEVSKTGESFKSKVRNIPIHIHSDRQHLTVFKTK